MIRRISQSGEATEDILEIALYLRVEDHDVAERFLSNLSEDIHRIAEMPGIGTIRMIGANRIPCLASIRLSEVSHLLSSNR